MDALSFIEAAKSPEMQPVYVLAGDELFLKRLASARIQTIVLGDTAEDFARSVYSGDEAELASVRDDLEMLPFLSPRRLVVVQQADPFVTKYREQLEDYVQKPGRTGVLVLEVKSWKSNTRLAKALPDKATIKCEAPAAFRLPQWCTRWAASHYGKELTPQAANLLVEFIGSEMGILDQELAKLTNYVGDKPKIEPKDVDTLVGHSRVQTAWQMLDAVAEGKKAQAIRTLQQLFDQGEEPIAILGAMSWQLRRLAQIARMCRQGLPLGAAISKAGIPPFAQQKTEQQIRHLGPRAGKLYDWLLEADLGAKSSDRFSPRTVIERLMIRLAEPAAGA